MLIVSLPVPRNGNRPGYLLQPSQSNNAINVFDRSALLELRRAAHLQPVLRPASRDMIRYRAVRQRQSSRPSDAVPKDSKQQRPRATSFPPTSNPSTTSGRLGHPWVHRNWARTPWAEPKTPGSLQINLLFTMYAEHASGHKPMQNLIFFKRQMPSASTPIDLVELSGIEPLTPCLQSRCSPS